MRALLTAVLLAMLPATASAAEPIVGTWQFEGAKVKVADSTGTYQGVVVSGSYGGCAEVVHPGFVAWKSLTGSGLSYSGKTPWYNTDGCGSIGDGTLTITLGSTDSGTWSSTSPDGTTAGGTITRIGGATSEKPPKTNCTKGDKRVLCSGAQKKLVKTVIKRAKQGDVLGDLVKKNKQALLDASEPARDAVADVVIEIASYVLGYKKVELPSATLPKLTVDWRTLDLPTLLDRGPDFRGKDALVQLYAFAKESDKALQYTNELMSDADTYYASSPDATNTMDTISQTVNGGRNFNDPTLTTDERFVVACYVDNLSGARKKLINHMVELGKAGANVTHTLP